jgi:NitT/TauT family transport system ATP-binding protein
VRDKLNIGVFDAAHLLAPVAIASSLGLGHIKVPIVAPFNLAMNGNAITVSLPLYAQLRDVADGDLADPSSSAQALAEIVRLRGKSGAEPLTFGMTFPFSTHNYQLRYWMAAGGIDPDEDVRLVVLPPPYMMQSLSNGQVDGFCVGAPWNSLAVNASVGRILHFGVDIFAHAPEKLLALRESFAESDPSTVAALTRAHIKAANFVGQAANHEEVAAILARSDRVGVDAKVIQNTLDGRLRVALDGALREDPNYLLLGQSGAGRPDQLHAVWLYAQMLRWGQVRCAAGLEEAAKRTYRADLYDAAHGDGEHVRVSEPISAFAGPSFDDRDLARYLEAFSIGRKI